MVLISKKIFYISLTILSFNINFLSVYMILLGFAALYPNLTLWCWVSRCALPILHLLHLSVISCVFNNCRTCRHVTCRLGRASRNPTKSAASQVALCFTQPVFLLFAAFIHCGLRLEWPAYCIKKKIIKAYRWNYFGLKFRFPIYRYLL